MSNPEGKPPYQPFVDDALEKAKRVRKMLEAGQQPDEDLLKAANEAVRLATRLVEEANKQERVAKKGNGTEEIN